MASSKAIVIRGPTASGKTDLSLKLSEKLPLEVISVDSVMVYKGLDIGSAKPSKEILKQYPHHLIDICDPRDKYSVGKFVDDAQEKIKDIQSKNRIPILVGGTMMYYKVLQDGLSELPSANDEVRNQIEQKAREIGWSKLHSELEEIDPEAAQKIKPNDKQRIQRAMEVYMISGVPISELRRESKNNNEFKFLNITLMPNDREELYRNINSRFDSMIKEGLLDEITSLLDERLVSKDSHSMQSIGYREMLDYIGGEVSLDDAIDAAKMSSRRYAKRQITWLRSMDDPYKLDPSDNNNLKSIQDIINSHFEAKN
ncbi:MAG TPA: tRNA (adenosine(37)-N6)-dimethylallyltransferase MiaA [Gammaproteobacteria bacterium]|nr:tRNA (adenosine(37)-N6)-dimethylallyltransferase MiaA [Gammaproteobacteria bacterium]HJM09203.1 tRNA (adenosine(37)-N6)-dimethylallyltransferase MiaA [Gammaproteobacteria bacterium]HJN00685.1 tRNA (adenosine(37)-N6)-dimethylallyltransferase MiaA [Gammaproteobacteria bacterium]